jgi:hypothetical protein
MSSFFMSSMAHIARWTRSASQPVAVLQPPALLLDAALEKPAPVVVDLVLRVALDLQRHRFGERELRAAVDADEALAVDSNATVITVPAGPGASSGYRAVLTMPEFGKTEQ